MKFLIPKTAVRTLTFTAILTTLLYLLTPALFSQSSTDTPAKTTQTEIKDAKDAPAATEKPAEAAPKNYLNKILFLSQLQLLKHMLIFQQQQLSLSYMA